MYLSAVFHRKASPYLLPAVSFVLRFCRNDLVFLLMSGFCVPVDEPSVIGFSIWTPSHNYTWVQAASYLFDNYTVLRNPLPRLIFGHVYCDLIAQ